MYIKEKYIYIHICIFICKCIYVYGLLQRDCDFLEDDQTKPFAFENGICQLRGRYI